MTEKPEYVTEEHLDYLNHLDKTNISDIYRCLKNRFPSLSIKESKKIVDYWRKLPWESNMRRLENE